MSNSTHKVEVVRIKNLDPLPNSDNLLKTDIWGYQCIVRKGEWSIGDLAAYIPPDNIVPATEQFKFLGNNLRIKTRRFRGHWSQGLLVKAPEGSKEGDNVANILGITHYVPPESGISRPGGSITNSSARKAPNKSSLGYYGVYILPDKYDLESWYREKELMSSAKDVIITEKIHGSNARYTFVPDNRGFFKKIKDELYTFFFNTNYDPGVGMFCGSRNEWKLGSTNGWAKALTPEIQNLCEDNPEYIVYGEIYGHQDLKYGLKNGEIKFLMFDVWDGRAGKWLPPDYVADLSLEYCIPMVPMIYVGPYSEDIVKANIDGPSLVEGADNIREGIVVESLYHRLKLKCVSNDYLERA